MSAPSGAAGMIEGRVVHKANNALKMTFQDGPGDPIAVAVQGAGDSRGKKLGILFGFKNGGIGRHQLTYRDGSTFWVESKDYAPSIFTRGDGVEIATIQRDETSTALLSGGTALFHFVPDPEEAKTYELFRMLVQNTAGVEIGRLDVIRRAEGWSLSRAVGAAYDTFLWWDHAGQALPVPFLGTRLLLKQGVSGIERDVLLGACVDMAIGLRPYVAAMK